MAKKLKDEKPAGPVLTEEVFLEQVARVKGAQGAVETAKVRLASAYKTAKALGVNRKILNQALALKEQGRRATQEEFDTLQQYCTWLKAPIGTQFSLLERETADVKSGFAGSAGHVAELHGKTRDSNPHAPGSEAYAQWDQGWMRGQADIAEELGNGTAPPPSDRRPRGRKATSEAVGHA